MLDRLMKWNGYDLSFTMLDVGARPLKGQFLSFYKLLEVFENSRIVAFEVDRKLCDELNGNGNPRVHYYPYALGRAEEVRCFYDTKHPMCSSLYRPNESLIGLYQNLEVAELRDTQLIETMSLDRFCRENQIGPVDFIKIDIQGAELDVFKGAEETLKDVLVIVSEVSFVEIYANQPLFGDVSSYLNSKGFSFHKFTGLSGRAMKPMVFKNNLNYAAQHMWADAIFVRDCLKLDRLNFYQLLKTAVLVDNLGSYDLAHFALVRSDGQAGTELAKGYMEGLTKKGPKKRQH